MWAGHVPPSCGRQPLRQQPERQQGDMRGPGGLHAFPLPCALGGQTDGVPGLNSCCQGVRGTSSPALAAGTLVHSCAAALRGWGAVGLPEQEGSGEGAGQESEGP